MSETTGMLANTCEIIRRLAVGGLTKDELDNIGTSLASGKTLAELEELDRLAEINNNFGGVFGKGSSEKRA